MSIFFTEADYENSVIELFKNDLGYRYAYGPDVERDFYAPKVNPAALSVGMVVQHDRFGVGEVQATEGSGENAKATIKFRNAGVKTLLLKFAKLKIIG